MQAMSRATFVALFLLILPHVAEARAAGRETPIRATLICETDVGRVDAPDPRSCNELKPQRRFQQNGTALLGVVITRHHRHVVDVAIMAADSRTTHFSVLKIHSASSRREFSKP